MSNPGESAQQNETIRGIRIRYLNYGFIIALAIFSIVLFVATLFLSSGYQEVTRIADNYHQVERDAIQVQAASDDLTRDVEFFVLTGKKRYLDHYFAEANVTRRRESAIEDIKQLHVTDSMIDYLEDAVLESMDLMELEFTAMRYAAEGYGLDLATLPQPVQDAKLPEVAHTMTDETKIETAREIVYGDEYLAYKNRISDFERKYLDEAIRLLDSMQASGRHKMDLLLGAQWVAILMIIILGAILFYTISRMIVHPLDQAVSSIARGETVTPLNGIYEVQYMAQSYNGFHAQSLETQKLLKQNAERDALTGVLNRRGYQTVIDRLASETFPLALLIFDIDEFKYVNDNFGHEVGDVALQKMATLLKDTFRTTDITSRIGGDEFTVIVLNVTEENKDAIARKVKSINEAMKVPGPDKCPPLTASVGCAFSAAGFNNYSFTEADNKMYEAKKAGGGRIRFS